VLRGLRGSLRDALLGAHGSGTLTRLAEVGLGFTRTGQLTLDRSALTAALNANPAAVQSLFADASSPSIRSSTTTPMRGASCRTPERGCLMRSPASAGRWTTCRLASPSGKPRCSRNSPRRTRR
jgi:hypothetical protein